jgi:hypothetical protein
VERAEEGGEGRSVEARWGEVAGGAQRSRVMPRRKREAQGIPQGTLAVSNVRAEKQTNSEKRLRSAGESSGATARSTRQRDVICQNIIGRSMAVGAGRLWSDGIIHGEDRTLALLDEPAGKHRGSVFFHVLIEEFSDFLAEIGGVSEARELVGLERGAGSGEKEFPRSLGAELRHVVLRSNEFGEGLYINNRLIYEDSNFGVYRPWKAVEKQENVVGMCIGCAGDYEDPDWTAWDEENDEEGGDDEDVEK